jgi:RNA polymerase sigma-70 factor (ECF subfamily)
VSDVSDDSLIERVVNGEQQALLSLYDRYSGRVYALVLRMLGDSMAAEEITQDVFLKLWARARSYLASRGAFAPWLLTIARNTALDRLRLERRRPTLADDAESEESWKDIPDGESTSEEARWRALYFAVQALPPEQRQVIYLAYYQGLSHSQIAEHLGWPVGTVKTRLRLGMAQLRQQWLTSPEEMPGRMPGKIPEEKSKTGSSNVS